MHRSLVVPVNASFWRKMIAFAGPGFLVAVGYMDPGNWATDLAGGSKYNYALLSVIMLSNLMAIVLQALSLKLGIVTGRDLAQACRDNFSRPVSFFLWIICELAIAACDLAEIIGSAIALQLLFGVPLIVGVCLTALDVLIVLFLQNKGFRYIEALVIALIAVIGGCFAWELIASRPDLLGIAKGFIPSRQIVTDPGMLYIAIGILGATVMPHNLYLHSSIVQTRRYELSTFRQTRSDQVRHDRFDARAHVRALYQCGHPDRLGRDVLHARTQRHRGNPGRVSTALAHARRDRREHTLRARAARFRSEFHPHRNAGRTDRDGRFSQHPHPAVAAPSGYARHCHYSGRDRDHHFRRKRNGALARAQPGDLEPAIKLCGFSAGHVYERQIEDGRVREPRHNEKSGVVDRGRDCIAQRLAARANISRMVCG